MVTRFISDLHLGHANIMKYEPSRPGGTVDGMDSELVRLWNETVGTEDVTYVLGDVSWHSPGRTVELLGAMNGRKVLVKGNHDHESMLAAGVGRCFDRVVSYATLSMPKRELCRKVVLSHYPIPFFDSARFGAVHLYGHVHDTEQYADVERLRRTLEERYGCSWRMFNVGCMMPYMGFRPRTLDEIVSSAVPGGAQ